MNDCREAGEDLPGDKSEEERQPGTTPGGKAKVALLIDADNLGARYRHRVERVARQYGEIAVCLAFAIRPMQAWTSDGALASLKWGKWPGLTVAGTQRT